MFEYNNTKPLPSKILLKEKQISRGTTQKKALSIDDSQVLHTQTCKNMKKQIEKTIRQNKKLDKINPFSVTKREVQMHRQEAARHALRLQGTQDRKK